MMDYTIKDIAKLAGVSTRTVSRVINKEKNVKEETRQRVEKIIKDTGYQANPIARSLRGNKTGILIVFVAENAMYYLPRFHNLIIRHLNIYANKLGYKLIVSKSSPTKSKIDENDGFYLLKNRYSDGAVVFDTSEMDYRLKYLDNNQIPYVTIGKNPMHTNCSFVNLDNVKAGYLGAEYLIKKGYKSLLFLLADKDFTVNYDRACGFVQACQDNDLKSEEIIYGVTTPDIGYQKMKEVLNKGKLPEAVFVSGDERAMGVYHAIREKGLKIPEDIAVLGIDNLPISAYLYPSLSSIDQSSQEMAKEAIKIIDRMLKNKNKNYYYNKILQPVLIEREST